MSSNARHYILATAGHVDHGKSALVKALTGTDPDRLPEEKARGITIDLGFAHLELPEPNEAPSNSPTSKFSIGIVDVPGHEDFVKNMVAGVGSIDLALFIVAADDGWMPQTEEHLQILMYLGVSRAIVALTKSDLAETESSLASSVEQVRLKLQDTPFSQAPIIPTSVIRGTGLEELKHALALVLLESPTSRDYGKPRLPVDRVFTLRGIGTVITGTLIGGNFKRGQGVVVQPLGTTARIRTLQTHNCEVESAGPGTRTALNLPDLARHSDQETEGIRRGDVITLPEFGAASDTLDVVLTKSSRLIESKSGAARPLKDGALVRIHHGSANVPARLSLFQRTPLEPGGSVLAQLRCESPLFAFAGDHFIVRDWAEQWTLAGGVILDPDSDRKRFHIQSRQKLLSERAGAFDQATAFVASQLARDGAISSNAILLKSRFSAVQISEAASKLVTDNRALKVGEWIADASWWQGLRKRGTDAIDAEHKNRPQHLGLPLSELKRIVEEHLPSSAMFEALLSDLCKGGFIQAGTTIRRASHRPALPPHLHAAGQRLRGILSAKPFDPPSRKELAPDATAQQALRFLIETGEAAEAGDEVVLLADAYACAVEIVKGFLLAHKTATVSELRQAIGASRRIVVPLLERLDKEGVTRREGDKRVLRPKI